MGYTGRPARRAMYPATRIAALVDLSKYLDPDGDIWPADAIGF